MSNYSHTVLALLRLTPEGLWGYNINIVLEFDLFFLDSIMMDVRAHVASESQKQSFPFKILR